MNRETQKISNKQIILIIISAILAFIVGMEAVSIFSNLNKKEPTPAPTLNTHTVMVYMVGADLESKSGLGTVDLEALNYNKTNASNTNVVVIAGGSKSWLNSYISSSETSIYELQNNGLVKVKQQNQLNMGDSNVLSDYLNYVYNNYKTDKYDLIFWNHGGGILGSEFDEITDDNLDLMEIKNGLASSPFKEDNKLETIIFRTCLNGSLEMAAMLDDYSNYLVASEEVTVGTTLTPVLGFINDIEESDTAYDLSLKYINSYKKLIGDYKDLYFSYYGSNVPIYTTYSIIDLSKIDNLLASVDDFFGSINIIDEFNNIAKVRSNLYQYGSSEEYYDMIDLYNLVDSLKSMSQTKANKLLSDMKNAIVYNYATNSSSRGLSIYFPYNGNKQISASFLNIYQDFNELENYYNFIKKFNTIQNDTVYNYSFKQNEIKVATGSEEPDFTLELTDEQKSGFARAEYIVFKGDGDGYFIPIYRGKEVSLNGNTLQANIKDRQLKIVGEEDGAPIETPLRLVEKSNNEQYTEYETVVTLENFSDPEISNWLIDNALATMVYDKTTNKIGISKLLLYDEDLPSTVALDINDYTYIVFASSKFKILDENGKYTDDWESNGIIEGIETETNDLQFRLDKLDDGAEYYCVFRIYDTTNKSYYSELVKMK